MASPLNAPPKGVDAKYGDDSGSVINTTVDKALNWLLNWGRAG